MERVAWFVLQNGRSVVAGCGDVTRESIELALSNPATTLTFLSEDATERIAGRDVRGFVIFESRFALPESASIYRELRV